MATAVQSTADSIPRGGRSRARLTAVLSDYWMLTKPEVNFLIVLTTLAGFYLVSPPRPWRILLLFNTLLGTLLVASGTGTLNQYIERNFDSLMRRTSRRPLPAGRIVHVHALWFGLGLSIAGGLWLAVFVNLIASLIALLTLGYLFAFLYADEAADSAMYLSWCISGRRATLDRMRCRDGQNNLGGLVALFDSLPVAVSAFYGYRLDVSGGLCAGGVSDLTSWTTTDALHGLADVGFLIRPCANHARAFVSEAGRSRILCCSSPSEFGIPLLLCSLRNLEIEPGRAPITVCVNCLSTCSSWFDCGS